MTAAYIALLLINILGLYRKESKSPGKNRTPYNLHAIAFHFSVPFKPLCLWRIILKIAVEVKGVSPAVR